MTTPTTPQTTPVSTTPSSEVRKEPTNLQNTQVSAPSTTPSVPNIAGSAPTAKPAPNTPPTAPGAASASAVKSSAPATPQTAASAPILRSAQPTSTTLSSSEHGKAPAPAHKAPISPAPATPTVPTQTGNLVTATKADLTPQRLATMHTNLKAQPVTSVSGNPSSASPNNVATPTAPAAPVPAQASSAVSKTPAPSGSTPVSSGPTELPPDSPEAISARIKARREQAELEAKKKRRIRKFAESLDRPKPKKGEYIQKLKEMQFEKLSDAEAKIAYDLLQSRLEKHSLQRNVPIKALFTQDEFNALEKAATALRIEKARLVRKLCFSGEASVEVLDKLEELRLELNRIGNNINQIAHVLQLKKTTFTDDIKHHLDKELKDLRVQIANLERRVAR